MQTLITIFVQSLCFISYESNTYEYCSVLYRRNANLSCGFYRDAKLCIEALKCVSPNISPWKKEGDWKARYQRLYSSQRLVSLPRIDESNRISFLTQDSSPYTSLLLRLRAKQREDGTAGTSQLSSAHTLLSPKSDITNTSNPQFDDWGGNETLLLDMVRARSRSIAGESADKRLELPRENENEDDYETCMHGLGMPLTATERSVSRSRVSRISTRRDMDIPSILAYNTGSAPAPAHLEMPAFQRDKNDRKEDEVPRWSIRRSVCPVCSQKWRDRSSIKNVKNSGLKRNSSQELPSVIAPARLRTSITIEYVPRPTLAAVDEDAGLGHSGLRSTSAAWQLTRARRFRTPKTLLPSPEDRAPPSVTAPLARKDLDIRVNKFLSDEQMKRKA